MKFWDSSAIMPLLVREAVSERMERLIRKDAVVVAWWGSGVECASALARREREATRKRDRDALARAFARLEILQNGWQEVQPGGVVRELALRLLRVHPLAAADALQLAAAILAAEHRPATLGFVCLEERLALAATREGFRLHDAQD